MMGLNNSISGGVGIGAHTRVHRNIINCSPSL